MLQLQVGPPRSWGMTWSQSAAAGWAGAPGEDAGVVAQVGLFAEPVGDLVGVDVRGGRPGR